MHLRTTRAQRATRLGQPQIPHIQPKLRNTRIRGHTNTQTRRRTHLGPRGRHGHPEAARPVDARAAVVPPPVQIVGLQRPSPPAAGAWINAEAGVHERPVPRRRISPPPVALPPRARVPVIPPAVISVGRAVPAHAAAWMRVRTQTHTQHTQTRGACEGGKEGRRAPPRRILSPHPALAARRTCPGGPAPTRRDWAALGPPLRGESGPPVPAAGRGRAANSAPDAATPQGEAPPGRAARPAEAGAGRRCCGCACLTFGPK